MSDIILFKEWAGGTLLDEKSHIGVRQFQGMPLMDKLFEDINDTHTVGVLIMSEMMPSPLVDRVMDTIFKAQQEVETMFLGLMVTGEGLHASMMGAIVHTRLKDLYRVVDPYREEEEETPKSPPFVPLSRPLTKEEDDEMFGTVGFWALLEAASESFDMSNESSELVEQVDLDNVEQLFDSMQKTLQLFIEQARSEESTFAGNGLGRTTRSSNPEWSVIGTIGSAFLTPFIAIGVFTQQRLGTRGKKELSKEDDTWMRRFAFWRNLDERHLVLFWVKFFHYALVWMIIGRLDLPVFGQMLGFIGLKNMLAKVREKMKDVGVLQEGQNLADDVADGMQDLLTRTQSLRAIRERFSEGLDKRVIESLDNVLRIFKGPAEASEGDMAQLSLAGELAFQALRVDVSVFEEQLRGEDVPKLTELATSGFMRLFNPLVHLNVYMMGGASELDAVKFATVSAGGNTAVNSIAVAMNEELSTNIYKDISIQFAFGLGLMAPQILATIAPTVRKLFHVDTPLRKKLTALRRATTTVGISGLGYVVAALLPNLIEGIKMLADTINEGLVKAELAQWLRATISVYEILSTYIKFIGANLALQLIYNVITRFAIKPVFHAGKRRFERRLRNTLQVFSDQMHVNLTGARDPEEISKLLQKSPLRTTAEAKRLLKYAVTKTMDIFVEIGDPDFTSITTGGMSTFATMMLLWQGPVTFLLNYFTDNILFSPMARGFAYSGLALSTTHFAMQHTIRKRWNWTSAPPIQHLSAATFMMSMLWSVADLLEPQSLTSLSQVFVVLQFFNWFFLLFGRSPPPSQTRAILEAAMSQVPLKTRNDIVKTILSTV